MAMSLPFSQADFLAVFAAYNHAVWPAALVLWLLTIGALCHLYRRGRHSSRIFCCVLALQWIWAGVVYHWVFFRAINPAATLFGALFVLQGLLLLYLGVHRTRLTFTPLSTGRGWQSGILMAYALVYPVVGLAAGLRYPRLPTFGVPCPTALFTIGALLIAPRSEARLTAALPLLWAGVGGSAAFVLGMRADVVLLLAGGALLLHILPPASTDQGRAA